jgi:hypothetical protein
VTHLSPQLNASVTFIQFGPQTVVTWVGDTIAGVTGKLNTGST